MGKIYSKSLLFRVVLLGLILSFFFPASAQSPYSLSLKNEGSLLGSGIGLLAIDYVMNQKLVGLTENEILYLDAQAINAFDRFATQNNSTSAARRSDIGFYGSITLAAGTALAPFCSAPRDYFNRSFVLAVILFETNLTNYTLTDITKNLFRRNRPYVYNQAVPLEEKQQKDARKSFFSGHTSTSAANSFFVAKVLADYYPESKWKPLFWALAAAIPAWTAIERVEAGKHFPTDVITGYALGALCGYFIPNLHKPGTDRATQFSLYPFNKPDYKGIGMVIRWNQQPKIIHPIGL